MPNVVRLLALILVFQPISGSAWTAMLENGDTTLVKVSAHHSDQSAPASHAMKISESQGSNCCSSGSHHDMEDCLATCLINCTAACAAPAIVPADIGLHHFSLGDQYWPISQTSHASRSEPPEIHPPHLYRL